MRAVAMRDWTLRVDEVPDPVPGDGQVLARVLACGICGSDLHMLRHGAELKAITAEVEATTSSDAARPVSFEPDADCVMGHEFCCEVVETGRGVTELSVGDRVVSYPAVVDPTGAHPVGYSNRYPGGYGELMVLDPIFATKVVGDLPADLAALTEPMAVGVHAVAKSRIAPGDAALVLGLGPVGLACVAALRRLGIGPIVGADFSPRRRSLAVHLGADDVIDPAPDSAFEAVHRAAGDRPLVVFEAVGVPGMIDHAMRHAPRDARILVVGVCMPADQILPIVGITKELAIQFVLGYTPEEFVDTHRAMADGAWDLAPLITGTVDLDGVPGAFEALADPEQHAKILVVPG